MTSYRRVPALTDPSEQYLRSDAVREKFGGISDITLRRWVNDPEIGFPKPKVIGRRWFFKVGDIEAWEERQETKQ